MSKRKIKNAKRLFLLFVVKAYKCLRIEIRMEILGKTTCLGHVWVVSLGPGSCLIVSDRVWVVLLVSFVSGSCLGHVSRDTRACF